MNAMRGLAHDMRAPLAAIEARCALMARRAGGDPALLRDVERIRMACSQLTQMTEAMLGGAASASPEVCTPEEIVRAAAFLYEERVDVQMTGDCGAPMLADAGGVRRIVTNLLSNAAKYSTGRIALRADAARRGETVCLRIEVEDDGPGMSEGTLGGLFAPGVRGEAAQGIPGHGLGLWTAQALARGMGGEIAVQSSPGAGSVFAFTAAFPKAAFPQAAFPRAACAADALAGKRFLVAEDSALARDALCELMRAHGAQAVGVQDGREAVEAFAQSAVDGYDAVLLDGVMPGMDGLAAARAIRAMERPDAGRIRLIVLTGAVFPEAAGAARALRMAYAVKPMTMERLAALINS